MQGLLLARQYFTSTHSAQGKHAHAYARRSGGRACCCDRPWNRRLLLQSSMSSMANEYTSFSLVSRPCCSSSGLMYAMVPACAGHTLLGKHLLGAASSDSLCEQQAAHAMTLPIWQLLWQARRNERP